MHRSSMEVRQGSSETWVRGGYLGRVIPPHPLPPQRTRNPKKHPRTLYLPSSLQREGRSVAYLPTYPPTQQQ
jgi:hypothetical protein